MADSPKWTRAQQQAISCRGGTVLVSAAAGSGKTAVLVQRVIDILTDREHPVDADRILVVTFSNAAAEEMRQRINARLSELLAENPTDSYLLRQRTLLSAAHISTVHSFCLELVRANFQLLDIPADFRLGSQNEIDLLEEDVAVQTIEQNYEDNDGSFSDLVELVSSGRDDKGLQDTLHRLYGFVRSHPFYREWLDEKLLMYDDTIPVGQTVWGQVILLVKGLHKVVVLSAVCLIEPLLGKPHLIVDGTGSTVPSGYKPTIFPCGFLLLLDIAQHTTKSTAAPATVLNCGKGCH